MTVKNPTGTTIAAYTYDAQGRRVTEAYPGQLTTDLYYSKDWQVLEADQGGAAVQQYTWSPFYVDGLIARDDHTPGESGTALDRRLYAEQDANYNVTSLTNASGTVVERYAYDPYGAVAVENTDGTIRGTGAASASNYGWTILQQGLDFSEATDTYVCRRRMILLNTSRFAQQDSDGYIDGSNLYQREGSSPVSRIDSSGKFWKEISNWVTQDFGHYMESLGGAGAVSGAIIAGVFIAPLAIPAGIVIGGFCGCVYAYETW